jgi:viroplasmin and RNaseH domain-containing protein
MSNKKKTIYVVVNGRKPGIYSKWFGDGETAEQRLKDSPKQFIKVFTLVKKP